MVCLDNLNRREASESPCSATGSIFYLATDARVRLGSVGCRRQDLHRKLERKKDPERRGDQDDDFVPL